MFEVAAVQGSANASLLAGYGYAGILVAFAARQNPLAIIVCALMIGGIEASGSLLQRRSICPMPPRSCCKACCSPTCWRGKRSAAGSPRGA